MSYCDKRFCVYLNKLECVITGIIAPLIVDMLQSRHVAKLDMYSLLFVETTNDMPFSLPETKYDEPFQMIGNISMVLNSLMELCRHHSRLVLRHFVL